MKYLLSLLITLSSITAYATPVDGEIFYKKPDGEVSTRLVTLEVPSRGQGEVILSNEKFEWRTTKFKSIEKNNRTMFIALFETSFLFFIKGTIALKGTYINGTNKIMYYGDFYKMKGHDVDFESLDENLVGFEHKGGFRFEYDR
ncbi:MAG: hypothetical protein CME61_04560 [Halobacteriovoraceae bacterium]|nr:hypothetical protein [Halobacteriovoraceae bacterium]